MSQSDTLRIAALEVAVKEIANFLDNADVSFNGWVNSRLEDRIETLEKSPSDTTDRDETLVRLRQAQKLLNLRTPK